MSARALRRTFAVVVLAGALLAAREGNASSAGPPLGLRIIPPGSAPFQALAAQSRVADPATRDFAAALRRAVGESRERARVATRARRSVVPDREDGIEVRWRSGVGTPMRIRGENLQPAAGGGAALADEGDTARAFLRAHRTLLRLDDPDDELEETRRADDALGRSHVWFSQKYGGLPVWPADLAVHLDARGNVDSMDGAYVPTPRSLSLRASIAAPEAVEIARGRVPLGEAAEATAPELIVYAPKDRAPRLAWRLELSASLADRWLVVVDALDGETLATIDLVAEANVAGSGIGVFGERLPLNVFAEGGDFFLIDTSKPMFDPSSDPPALDATRGAIVILDAANTEPDLQRRLGTQITSGTATGFAVDDGVSAAFGLSETYDYYLERHGRDSLDGRRGTILGIVRFGQNFFNAFWNGTLMVFGDAVPFAGALDVAGHELTHGVTQFTANLIYQNQSGALNEAFSDIFGEMVEARTKGAPDWVKGGELGEPLQNYADPGSSEIVPGSGRGYPASLRELLRPDDPLLDLLQGRDSGGVHINSAILNHAYYLLAEGLSGAIGIRDAERIFYRSLSIHLLADSQFIDARLAAVLSAEELFGAGSRQALKTAEAFDAVEIFDDVTGPDPPTRPPVESEDSALFVVEFDDTFDQFLGRREDALGDPPEGVLLSEATVAFSRPSVSGDGSIAAFVDAQNDVCLIATDGTAPESCLGLPGLVSAVAVAPDGNRFGFVLLDDFGDPLNEITVIDIDGEETRTFTLVSPEIDGGGLNTVLFADAMDFSVDGRMLVYDALNSLRLLDGSTSEVWSIYALDIDTGTTHTLVGPIPGVDIEFPALSQTSDSFITFDVVDPDTRESTILAGNLLTGDTATVLDTGRGFGAPSYTGDDGAIIYAGEDDSFLGVSLFRQPLAADGITPAGAPSLFLIDASLATIYRRGAYTPPRERGVCVGDCSANGVVTVNEIVTGVSVALERTPLSTCSVFDADGDGEVSVDELIAAVGDALGGC